MYPTDTGRPGTSPGGQGLGLSLLVIATAQLMLVLDDTVANIALPSIQRELAVPAATLPWIINAYILAFGGLTHCRRIGWAVPQRLAIAGFSFAGPLGLIPLAFAAARSSLRNAGWSPRSRGLRRRRSSSADRPTSPPESVRRCRCSSRRRAVACCSTPTATR